MGVAIAAASVASCAKKASTEPASAAPDAVGMAGGADSEAAMQAPSDDSIDEFELRLLTYEEGLLAAGVELPDQVQQARVKAGAPVTAAATAGSTDTTDRCERICLLAANICDLRSHICELADEHDTETRYRQACERAALDCERVGPICEDCDDSTPR